MLRDRFVFEFTSDQLVDVCETRIDDCDKIIAELQATMQESEGVAETPRIRELCVQGKEFIRSVEDRRLEFEQWLYLFNNAPNYPSYELDFDDVQYFGIGMPDEEETTTDDQD